MKNMGLGMNKYKVEIEDEIAYSFGYTSEEAYLDLVNREPALRDQVQESDLEFVCVNETVSREESERSKNMYKYRGFKSGK